MRGGEDAAALVAEKPIPFGVWQPIDTAPRGEPVLIFSPDASEWYAVVIAYFVEAQGPDDEDCWYSQEENIGQPIDAWPTHWMPLPDDPEISQ